MGRNEKLQRVDDASIGQIGNVQIGHVCYSIARVLLYNMKYKTTALLFHTFDPSRYSEADPKCPGPSSGEDILDDSSLTTGDGGCAAGWARVSTTSHDAVLMIRVPD
jgi:hypothetical protein